MKYLGFFGQKKTSTEDLQKTLEALRIQNHQRIGSFWMDPFNLECVIRNSFDSWIVKNGAIMGPILGGWNKQQVCTFEGFPRISMLCLGDTMTPVQWLWMEIPEDGVHCHFRCGKVGMGGYHARGGMQFNGNWERTRLTGGSVKRSQIYPRSHQVVYEAVKKSNDFFIVTVVVT